MSYKNQQVLRFIWLVLFIGFYWSLQIDLLIPIIVIDDIDSNLLQLEEEQRKLELAKQPFRDVSRKYEYERLSSQQIAQMEKATLRNLKETQNFIEKFLTRK